jgi:molecular chaperone GrpE (heat shock protein)
MKEQEVTSIRIVVQPEISTWRPPTPTSVKLASAKTSMSAQQLDDLTQKLADSPLKRALGKIQAKRQNVSKRALTDKAKSDKK